MASVQELQQNEVIYIIILGSIGMLIFVVGFAAFIMIYQRRILKDHEKRRMLEVDYQQRMIQSQIDSQEVERKRIAADLHDSISSLLWAAKLNIAFIGRSLNLTGELKSSYDETFKILDQSIDSVKRISWELTPEVFRHAGLADSIDELCRRLNGKGFALVYKHTGQSLRWKDNRALMVYRIVQELVSNSIKHAEATLIEVNLHWKENLLLIEVSDNGIGFELDQHGNYGLGWWNIMNRSKIIDAAISHENKSPGSLVTLNIPYPCEKI